MSTEGIYWRKQLVDESARHQDTLDLLDAAEAKLARIDWLCDRPEATDAHDEPLVSVASVRAILRGES